MKNLFYKYTYGFTLAEVLITLGIIGVVAAMTLPTLVKSYTNHVVETRLQKFYSSINQALIRAEVDYGDRDYWYQYYNSIDKDAEGNIIPGNSMVEKWYRKYIYPYMKTIKIEDDSDGLTTFYFADGSALKAIQRNNMQDWYFYTGNPEKCKQKYSETESEGRCAFWFIYMPNGTSNEWRFHYKKGFEPYKYAWDGTRDGLFNGSYTGCNNSVRRYCTALIQYNGWKIPKDYPFKVSY